MRAVSLANSHVLAKAFLLGHRDIPKLTEKLLLVLEGKQERDRDFQMLELARGREAW